VLLLVLDHVCIRSNNVCCLTFTPSSNHYQIIIIVTVIKTTFRPVLLILTAMEREEVLMPLLIIDTVARRARGVVTAAEDGCVRVFQLASPRKVATFQGLLCLFVRA